MAPKVRKCSLLNLCLGCRTLNTIRTTLAYYLCNAALLHLEHNKSLFVFKEYGPETSALETTLPSSAESASQFPFEVLSVVARSCTILRLPGQALHAPTVVRGAGIPIDISISRIGTNQERLLVFEQTFNDFHYSTEHWQLSKAYRQDRYLYPITYMCLTVNYPAQPGWEDHAQWHFSRRLRNAEVNCICRQRHIEP